MTMISMIPFQMAFYSPQKEKAKAYKSRSVVEEN